MSWAAAAVGAGSAIGGFLGGEDAPDVPEVMKKLMKDARKYSQETQQNVSGQMEWAKDFWGDQQLGTLTETLGMQLPMMKSFYEESQKSQERYETTFQPLEDSLVREAEEYGSQEKQELEAGRAQADVARSFEAQRENALQRLEDYGVDPSQTRNAALDREVRVTEAAVQAGAGNMARERTQQIGRDLRSQAINVGGATAGRALQQGQLAGQTAASAVQGVSTTGQTGAGMQGSGVDWSNATAGMLGQANTASSTQYGAQMDQYNAGGDNTIGDAFATGMGAYIGKGGTFGFAEGGEVEGPGGPTDDAVPINASDGEFVMPDHVVRKKGTDFFNKLIEKSLEEDEQQPEMKGGIPSYGCGGPVRSYATGGFVHADGRNRNYATGIPAQPISATSAIPGRRSRNG